LHAGARLLGVPGYSVRAIAGPSLDLEDLCVADQVIEREET
jgi:hypothetical protein